MAESTTRKPWYAAALAGGFGAVLGVGTLLGLPAIGTAHGQEPHVSTSSLAPGAISLDQRLERIERAVEKLQKAWDRLPDKCKPRGVEKDVEQ